MRFCDYVFEVETFLKQIIDEVFFSPHSLAPLFVIVSCHVFESIKYLE